jgi:hypothetical protein
MRESPIIPSIGRIVLVRGADTQSGHPQREYPALVTSVWGPNCVTVHVFNEQPGGRILTSVLYEDDLSATEWPRAWRWMDYQVAQAAKHEAA